MSESLGKSFVLRTSTSATNSNHQEKSSEKFSKVLVKKDRDFDLAQPKDFDGLNHRDVKENHIKITLKNFKAYLLPSMFTMMLMAVYTFTDTYVVGQKLGAVALGAVGVCTPVLTISYAFGFLFGMGGCSRYAISLGQGRKQKANRIFSTAVFGTLVFGILAAVVLNIFAKPFAFFLGANEENIKYVMPYLRVMLVYIPGFMMDIVMMCFMKNEGHPNIAMIATVAGTLMNVILDFLFVFGFNWGMFGAAFATALCSGIGCCINITFAYAKKMNIRFKKSSVELAIIPMILKNGVGVLVLESSSGIVTFVFIAQSQKLFGPEGAAVYTIIMNWSLIFINLVMGVAQAAQPLLGLAYGEGKIRHIKDYTLYSIVGSLILGTLFLVIGYGFTENLVSVFASDDDSVIKLAAKGLRLYLPAYLFMDLGIVLGYYFQSLGMAWQSLVVMLLRGVLLPCVFAFVLPLIFGSNALWLAVPLAEFLTSLVALVLFVKFRDLGARS